MNKLSFVIPAYNESQYIKRVITAIRAGCVTLPVSCEIIVVNNGSTDDTAKVVAQMGLEPLTIKRRRVAEARNIGAKMATGTIFCFVDGDTILTPNWFGAMKAFLRIGDYRAIDVVTGCCVEVPENPNWIESSWFANIGGKNYIGGANIICSQGAFYKLKGFDTSLETGEDYDFCQRAISLNISFSINKGFRAIHLGYPQSVKAFALREMWHGKGDAQSLKRFFSSKVSIVSTLFILFIFQAIVLGINFGASSGLAAVVLLLSINFILTIKLRHNNSPKSLLINTYLNFIYFTSRSLSPLLVVFDKIKRKIST